MRYRKDNDGVNPVSSNFDNMQWLPMLVIFPGVCSRVMSCVYQPRQNSQVAKAVNLGLENSLFKD